MREKTIGGPPIPSPNKPIWGGQKGKRAVVGTTNILKLLTLKRIAKLYSEIDGVTSGARKIILVRACCVRQRSNLGGHCFHSKNA
jgi:hypothetical protein